MKISELSHESGVPVPTIKFYLREHLIPPGRATSATQAEYDEAHLARLRLIRALTEVGRMPLARVRDVLTVVDAGTSATAAAVGTAHDALPPSCHGGPNRRRGPTAARLTRLARDPDSVVLATRSGAGRGGAGRHAPRAGSPRRLRSGRARRRPRRRRGGAERERADAVEYVVIGTVLYEPVLLALRRLAQQHVYTGGGAENPQQ